MSDDRFLNRLRDEAQSLRFEPDDVMTSRLAARVRARISETPSVSSLLASWLRPLAASLATVALVAGLSVAWIERASDPGIEIMASNAQEIAFGDELYTVSE